MIELIFKYWLLLYFKLFLVKGQPKSVFSKYSSYISSYKGFKELKYVDLLLLNLQRIKDVQGFKELQYVDLQLDFQRPTT